MENSKQTYQCKCCKNQFVGYGNNPYPLYTKGRVCDECNMELINIRLSKAFKTILSYK